MCLDGLWKISGLIMGDRVVFQSAVRAPSELSLEVGNGEADGSDRQSECPCNPMGRIVSCNQTENQLVRSGKFVRLSESFSVYACGRSQERRREIPLAG